MTLKTQGTYLFGDFQVNLAQRVLLCQGQAIALGPKTFDLLVYLVRNAQRVVSKDELLDAVWPNAHVEESNLSQHVFLLRKALAVGQSGEKPIVTVPGRGYQFTPRVREVSADGFATGRHLVLHAVESITRVVVEEEEMDSDDDGPALEGDGVPAESVLSLPASSDLRRIHLWWWGGAALLALAGAGGLLGWRWLHPGPVVAMDAVLVEAENRTGDADFDGALQRAVRIDVEQSPFVNLLPGEKIRQTLEQMQQPAGMKLTPALAREVCERNNAQVMLSAALSRLGSEYVLMLTAESCESGKQVAGAKVVAATKEKVLPALDAAASKLRQQLGASSGALARIRVPIAEATTDSLEAPRAYSQARVHITGETPAPKK